MSGLGNRFWNEWKRSFSERKRFSTARRAPFYDLAGKFLPEDPTAVVVDIGAGEGWFASQLKLADRFPNLVMLDGNPGTVALLKERGMNAFSYEAPGKLPFEDRSIQFIHCSHIIEHLYHQDLHSFLEELDRVLSESGILVVSAPLLSKGFYRDMSHVRPYSPEVLTNYLCGTSPSQQRSAAFVSEQYQKLELVYRYSKATLDEGWGSSIAVIDFGITLIRQILSKIGIARTMKTGFTVVLKKLEKESVLQ